MMADSTGPTRSLNDMLKESREKKRAEQLAQEIFGKRSQTPLAHKSGRSSLGGASLGASLASRVGVTKRTSSAPPRNSRVAPPQSAAQSRAGPTSARPVPHSNRPSKSTIVQPSPNFISHVTNNGYSGHDAPAVVSDYVYGNGNGNNNSSAGVSIRGAAAGPHIVVASNFASGTTAADIESVMLDVGGQMTDCRLLARHPTVMAEMTFVERSGAEAVINTFNNKKADGRTLHVYWKQFSTSSRIQPQIETAAEMGQEIMEVDENAQSREVENRLREERRGRSDRPQPPPYDPNPERGYDHNYYRGPRRAESAYQDGRFGFGGSGGGGERYGRRGDYRDEGRLYSDRVGRGGQEWRP